MEDRYELFINLYKPKKTDKSKSRLYRTISIDINGESFLFNEEGDDIGNTSAKTIVTPNISDISSIVLGTVPKVTDKSLYIDLNKIMSEASLWRSSNYINIAFGPTPSIIDVLANPDQSIIQKYPGQNSRLVLNGMSQAVFYNIGVRGVGNNPYIEIGIRKKRKLLQK